MPKVKYCIKVITRASRNDVVEQGSNNLKVYLTAVPKDNEANEALIKLLASYWHISKSKVQIIKGLKSKQKFVVVDD